MHGRKGTYSTAAPLTLLAIASTPGAAVAATAFASARFIRVYLVITVSTRVNIVYK